MTIIASTASLRFIKPLFGNLDRWAPSNPGRLGHYRDSQDALFFGYSGYDRKSSSGRAPSLPSETKTISAPLMLSWLFLVSSAAFLPNSDSFLPQAFGDIFSNMDFLRPCCGGFWASVSAVINSTFLTSEADHVVDRIVAGIADSDYFYFAKASIFGLTFVIVY